MSATAYVVRWPRCTTAQLDAEATVFTCSNGYIATRGTHPELRAGVPSAAIAGIFTNDQLGFRTLVTAADWLGIELTCAGRKLDPTADDVQAYERRFDLRRGLITRTLCWQPAGRGAKRHPPALTVETEHFCSLADQRLAVQRYTVRAGDTPAEITLGAHSTGRVRTRGEYMLDTLRTRNVEGGVTVTARTVGKEYQVAHHALVHVDGQPLTPTARNGAAHWQLRRKLRAGESLTLVKYVGFAADRDAGGGYADMAQAAAADAARVGWEAVVAAHTAAWARVWRDADIEIVGDDANALALHYVTAQLLGHCPKDDPRVSLAAKPLCPEGYRGHVFWDTDLFMTPAVTTLRPEWGRHLIDYRWETLPGARKNAARWNYRGAWYPWESADDGSEVTPLYWLNTDGRKMPVTCWKYEIHSVCDVAYAAWDYYCTTGDRDWLLSRGVEILVETSRYWQSRATYVARHKRYEIHDVCGPDEAHERTNNCAYINVLARWNVERAVEALDLLCRHSRRGYDAFCKRIDLTAAELRDLQRFARQLYIPFDRKTGWYRQFDGYEDLKFIDPDTVQERYDSPPDAAETQVVKQADVIMLLYLLRHAHTREQIQHNWDYYVPRTAHGTSLSAGTHAAVAARLGLPDTARQYFTQAVNMDLLNWRGDSGRGLHGAALGGAICAAVFGFGGLEFHADQLSVTPFLPTGWQRLRIPFIYQGRRLCLDVRPEGWTLSFRRRGTPVRVNDGAKVRTLRPGQTLRGRLLPRTSCVIVKRYTDGK